MKKKNDYFSIFIIILCVLAIIPLVYIAIYSRPCVDDFEYSAQTHEIVMDGNYNIFTLILKAIKVDIVFYNTWQGLYTSAFILALQPGIFGEQYYCVGTWLLMLLMFLTIYYFIKTILKDLLKINKYAFLFSIALFSIIITRLPSAVQGLYWFNGAWNYMPFFFLTLLNIALMLRFYFLEKNKYLALSIALSFIISGGNHVCSFLNIMVLSVFNIFAIRKNKKVIFPLISAVIGFVIMFIAPGTKIRQSYHTSPGTIETIIYSMYGYISHFNMWCDLSYILMIMGTIPIAFYIKKEKKITRKNLKYNPLLFIIIKIVIICGMLCVPYKAMGGFGTWRLLNVIWIAFIVLSVIIEIYTIIWISCVTNNTIKFELNLLLKIILVLICINIFFGFKSNTLKAIVEIYEGSASHFAESFDSRLKRMQKTNENLIEVDCLPYDELLRFDDITPDVENWRNTSWKKYYGIDAVVPEEEYLNNY